MMETQEVVRKFRQSIDTWYIPVQSIMYIDFANCIFAYNVTHKSCIKVTILRHFW